MKQNPTDPHNQSRFLVTAQRKPAIIDTPIPISAKPQDFQGIFDKNEPSPILIINY